MFFTGSKLKECLTGEIDPLSLLFESRSASKVLEDFYRGTPMFATMTDQLVTMMTDCLKDLGPSQTVRILEVGAGTGGTTSVLAAHLDKLGIRIEYTFTDISNTLVAKAKKKYSQYKWMSFEKLDIEQATPKHLRGRFDIVSSTMCIHATKSKLDSSSRIRSMLKPGGFMVLSELTRIIDWYDIVFGLLEGWWMADGGASYPLQSAKKWMSIFNEAGFAFATHSRGGSEESNTQQLLVGINGKVDGY